MRRDMCSVEGHVQCVLTLNRSPSMGTTHNTNLLKGGVNRHDILH